MAERFTLRDLPKYEAIEALASGFDGLDAAATAVWLEVLRTGSDILGAYDEMVRGYGLSQGRFTTLMLLECAGREGDAGEWSRPSDLADRGGLSRPAMTTILESLASDGWLERQADPDDRRSNLVRLSGAGLARLHAILPEHFRAVSSLMSGLNKDDQLALATLLCRLRESVEQSDRVSGAASSGRAEG